MNQLSPRSVADLLLRDASPVYARPPVRCPHVAQELPASLCDRNAAALEVQDADGLSCSFSEAGWSRALRLGMHGGLSETILR
jgi:hypothetical protein